MARRQAEGGPGPRVGYRGIQSYLICFNTFAVPEMLTRDAFSNCLPIGARLEVKSVMRCYGATRYVAFVRTILPDP